MTILTSIPVWVFPLFLALLFLGLRATKRRSAPVWIIYALPLLGLMALRTVLGLTGPFSALGAFMAAYLVGMAFGYRQQGRWLLSHDNGRVELAGEWLTLIAMMGLFSANFVLGMVNGIAPELAARGSFVAGFSACTGFLSGTFAGRAVFVLRVS